jgi:hypothetical protein
MGQFVGSNPTLLRQRMLVDPHTRPTRRIRRRVPHVSSRPIITGTRIPDVDACLWSGDTSAITEVVRVVGGTREWSRSRHRLTGGHCLMHGEGGDEVDHRGKCSRVQWSRRGWRARWAEFTSITLIEANIEGRKPVRELDDLMTSLAGIHPR